MPLGQDIDGSACIHTADAAFLWTCPPSQDRSTFVLLQNIGVTSTRCSSLQTTYYLLHLDMLLAPVVQTPCAHPQCIFTVTGGVTQKRDGRFCQLPDWEEAWRKHYYRHSIDGQSPLPESQPVLEPDEFDICSHSPPLEASECVARSPQSQTTTSILRLNRTVTPTMTRDPALPR
jgi:hypothetical protein